MPAGDSEVQGGTGWRGRLPPHQPVVGDWGRLPPHQPVCPFPCRAGVNPCTCHQGGEEEERGGGGRRSNSLVAQAGGGKVRISRHNISIY